MARISLLALALLAAGCGAGINARAYSDSIVITGPLMEFTENRTEIAFVVAHEAGHVARGDTDKFMVASHEKIERELAADRHALAMIADAGHDLCLVVGFFDRLQAIRPDARSLPIRRARIEAMCRATKKGE